MKTRRYITQEEWNTVMRVIPEYDDYVRDRCILIMMYIHGLRVSELANIQLSSLSLESNEIYIRRMKNGFSTTHPVQKEEKIWLLRWLDIRKTKLNGKDLPWLFISARRTRISRQQVYSLVKYYGELAGLPVKLHPHVLRHSCGYALANQGLDTRLIQDYLGHRNIRHTVHYTSANCKRFSRVWSLGNEDIF
ncbi:tyrosine-type recombinase/integrase [Escherichia coli]|nr:tyrosine-type recombinase/integrase [Escherichia coli]EHN9960094.1 tyrosine-type recombinase/integrase [Escherichia coli]EHO1065080.1 tyrosine-type recombinase/integrase [Escherichia coli]EHP7646642.1 tyrosine-type recombinase/integrase [Escherichia coli]EHQ9107449.1 tyrosine-type recombinase/integrase [Escherichia coli]